jgi:hypothetical protein
LITGLVALEAKVEEVIVLESDATREYECALALVQGQERLNLAKQHETQSFGSDVHLSNGQHVRMQESVTRAQEKVCIVKLEVEAAVNAKQVAISTRKAQENEHDRIKQDITKVTIQLGVLEQHHAAAKLESKAKRTEAKAKRTQALIVDLKNDIATAKEDLDEQERLLSRRAKAKADMCAKEAQVAVKLEALVQKVAKEKKKPVATGRASKRSTMLGRVMGGLAATSLGAEADDDQLQQAEAEYVALLGSWYEANLLDNDKSTIYRKVLTTYELLLIYLPYTTAVPKTSRSCKTNATNDWRSSTTFSCSGTKTWSASSQTCLGIFPRLNNALSKMNTLPRQSPQSMHLWSRKCTKWIWCHRLARLLRRHISVS